MLIQALCDYYDILAQNGEIVPENYSRVNVNYLICLLDDGRVDKIIDISVKGENKGKKAPKETVMPKRTEKPGIDANFIEHRATYIFGLNMVEGKLIPDDRTDKARKSHKKFVETNLDFIEGIDSPVVNAYRNFIKTWVPENETENENLLSEGKEYGKYGYVFCLSGDPDKYLNNDPEIMKRWDELSEKLKAKEAENAYIAQCAIEGDYKPISQIHSKIKGVSGSLATGGVLVGYNNQSECSYGHEQSYNSNISSSAMNRYTTSLNYLLSKQEHRVILDDVTIVYWAMDSGHREEDVLNSMIFGTLDDKADAVQTDEILKSLMTRAEKGKVTDESIKSYDNIDPDVDFYIVGMKANSSRISVKFVYKRKFAQILYNIARFQSDIKISEDMKPVSFFRIKYELVSPNSSNDKVNPALMTKLFESIIYGREFPVSLLQTIVMRVKTDRSINKMRAGIIKACINRKKGKEEITMSLNESNENPAYLCGRLFAVLEKLQKEAIGDANHTIKDAYFASASSTPSLVFPKLIKLAQNHLNSVKKKKEGHFIFFNQLIGSIIEKIDDEFPRHLTLEEQGRFDIGYYQQYQKLYEKKDKIIDDEIKEDN